MDKQFYKKLLEKAISASKSNRNFIKTKGFFKFRVFEEQVEIEEIVNGEVVKSVKITETQSETRYERLETYESKEKWTESRKDIFLINELDKNNIFYAMHASFVGTSRYKFKLNEDGPVEFISNKMTMIR